MDISKQEDVKLTLLIRLDRSDSKLLISSFSRSSSSSLSASSFSLDQLINIIPHQHHSTTLKLPCTDDNTEYIAAQCRPPRSVKP